MKPLSKNDKEKTDIMISMLFTHESAIRHDIEMSLNTPIKIVNLSGTIDNNFNNNIDGCTQLISQIVPKVKILQVPSITNIIDTPNVTSIPVDIK